MLNETKGSMGMFSRAGKISSGMNIILARRDEIINNTAKKVRAPSMLSNPIKKVSKESYLTNSRMKLNLMI